uniref:Uncharacterized protein n=1 Tax=Tanacetum cinerariifolium TaxID=118510 RepID=A0A699HZ77_TANCI|nr:hypothetical protein [Tanacetum cinerariifolium]
MSSITTQLAKLNLELVPKEKRLDIGKCNRRLNLDALALTLSYSTFLITADLLEVYMHQFWDFVYKHDTFYRFKMDKRKRFKLTLEIFRDIMKICPRVQGQDFDALPTDEEIVSFLRELRHTGEINSLNEAWKFTKLASPKLTTVPVSTEELTGKLKRVKGPAKKSTKAPTRGIELLSQVALTEEAQFEEVRKKSVRDFHKTHLSGSGTVTKTAPSIAKIKPSITNEGTGIKPGVLDVTDEESYEIDADKGFIQNEGTNDEMINETEVPVTSSSHSSDLAAKFLNFTNIPTIDAKIVSPMDVHVHHEKKTSKDAEPAKGPKDKELQSDSSKGDKSQSKSSGKSIQIEEPEFEVADSDMPQDQEENPNYYDEEPNEKVASKRA